MSARRVSRLVLGCLCLAFITGPTPGAVGSCAASDESLDRPADLEAYCSEREQLVCVREYENGKLSLVRRDDCRRAAIARCERRRFLPGCRPTQRDANACLNALHSRSTLGLGVEEIDECARLCRLQNEDDSPRSIADSQDAGMTDDLDAGLAVEGSSDGAVNVADGDQVELDTELDDLIGGEVDAGRFTLSFDGGGL